MAAATVNVWTYRYAGDNFFPGQERTVWFGPWPWSERAVAVTAHPYNGGETEKALEVVRVWRVNPLDEFVLRRYIYVTVRNVGYDEENPWFLTLAEIKAV